MATKVIHIAKFFYDSTVHANFVESLWKTHGKECLTIVPDHACLKDSRTDGVSNFRYPYVFRFFLMTRTILSFFRIYIARVITPEDYLFCHTWVSDGLLGLLFKQTMGLRYTVLVRKTDLYFYYKKFVFYRPLFRLILSRADRIAFISISLEQSFHAWPELKEFAQKSRIWPNGIDDFWHKNFIEFDLDDKTARRERKEILFVGRFDVNKNLNLVFNAVSSIKNDIPEIRLVCVGGTRPELARLIGVVNSKEEWLTVIPKLDRNELMLQYRRASCLTVPSREETFGLVFIEALSQACPVIYTEGQAIDNFFKGKSAAQGVPPDDIAALKAAIIRSLNQNHGNLSVDQFRWSSVARLICEDLDDFQYTI